MQKNPFHKYLLQVEPMIKAVVELFHPLVEAAVHDLEQGKVIAIYHNLSRRKAGDLSPLKELEVDTQEFPDYFPPYYKLNWDGRPLKCTSVTIRNEKGKAVGLVCFNMDASAIQDAHHLLETLLKVKEQGKNPIEAFGGSCEEQAQALAAQYLEDNQLSLLHLTRGQKKDLVHYLYNKGIFNYKSAAPFIASYLNISRASVYNYIKNTP